MSTYQGKSLSNYGMIKFSTKPGLLVGVALQAVCRESSPFVSAVVGTLMAAKAIILIGSREYEFNGRAQGVATFAGSLPVCANEGEPAGKQRMIKEPVIPREGGVA